MKKANGENTAYNRGELYAYFKWVLETVKELDKGLNDRIVYTLKKWDETRFNVIIDLKKDVDEAVFPESQSAALECELCDENGDLSVCPHYEYCCATRSTVQKPRRIPEEMRNNE